MDTTKIIFFGTTDFSCDILQALYDQQYNVVAAVAQPDRPAGRKHRIVPTPVHALCDTLQIPCLQIEHLKTEWEVLKEYAPDLIITCAYGQLVPDEVLALPQLGCLNIHPSLLPKYRGAAPMHYAILNGDSETGVTLMEMVHKMDAGKIYAQNRISIGEDETLQQLEERLKQASVSLLTEALPKYLRKELPGIPQEEQAVTFSSMISREMECVSFEKEPLDVLYNHIRALIDWPLPYGMLDGKRVKFFEVKKEIKDVQEAPGTILGFKKGYMEVATKGGILRVYSLQLEGKKRMDANSFANGYADEVTGKRFA